MIATFALWANRSARQPKHKHRPRCGAKTRAGGRCCAVTLHVALSHRAEAGVTSVEVVRLRRSHAPGRRCDVEAAVDVSDVELPIAQETPSRRPKTLTSTSVSVPASGLRTGDNDRHHRCPSVSNVVSLVSFSIKTPAPTLDFCNPRPTSLGFRSRRQATVKAAAGFPEFDPH